MAGSVFLDAIFRRRKKHMVFNTAMEFDFHTIRAATSGFSDIVVFNSLYKGKLPDGQDIVVKILSRDLPWVERVIHSECRLLSRLQHKNLINLVGFCNNRNRFYLVFEFMPNSSLDRFIHEPSRAFQIPWEICRNIIGGVARGLRYLHEECGLRVIHRDIKPANILLDAEMNPKIAGFELAMQTREIESENYNTEIAGTAGYLAPEILTSGRFSAKSDVYSFGILILEIISRRRVLQPEEHLVTYVRRCWNEGRSLDIVHEDLREDDSITEITRFIHIALLCVDENVETRPNAETVLHWFSCRSSAALPLPSTMASSAQYESLSSPTSSVTLSDSEFV
ncbi:PREDICTED: cysteine-rich receptor-like protein kinase 45 isoform X2 [Tarenaya hassleriana]|uniref:cysteine-rich receptor-like protein kinase 45 isoform X2 n=1 Tax=Tarenaya hassleriana TaxID=28532 RepID=UPI00053C0C3F|nr:PREDICTED: cysteine-rich receptor-like protein kinase 45 isoform X2 [Tarenaya hassleriana]